MPSPQPLIREAADGDARNVLLLLEAGADLEAAQENKIGFTALNQAVSRLRVLARRMERGAWVGLGGEACCWLTSGAGRHTSGTHKLSSTS